MTLYPFSAIVGQDKLKKALLLCAVNPSIGGVLIRGEKGTAKSTAVRGLAAVMPPLDGSGEPVPFVDLPLGASEDRVLGSVDIEAILAAKTKKLLPGLLAQAHQGILYIDEVNLLADHLVDVLLDVAASGVNTVQREGLSLSHPARFVLIGTMNPEEGNLRPQLLDRFGLMVEVGAQTDVRTRTEVVRRRIAFEQDPAKFGLMWQEEQQLIREKIIEAKKLLPDVQMPDGLLSMISQLCMDWGVGSLRADIVLYKTAITLAALHKRLKVNPEDVREAAELVLIHRKGKKALPPQAPTSPADDDSPNAPNQKETESKQDPANECGEENCGDGTNVEIAAIDFRMGIPKMEDETNQVLSDLLDGKAIKAKTTSKGYQIRAEKNPWATDIAINETVIQALTRNPDRLEIGRDDLYGKVKNGKTARLILFVVDASGSMAAGRRMEAVKGSVIALLQDAYQKRNMVGVVSFRGVEATMLLEPTRSVEQAQQALESLPTGGRTPLPHALQLVQKVLDPYRSQTEIQPLIVLLSDGKANVPLPGAGGDAWQQSIELSRAIAEAGYNALVLDTEDGYVRQGKAKALADALGAEYMRIDQVSTEEVMDSLSGRIAI